jgi:NADH pyrophosphatase NudC (nudix superfamily)
MTIAIAALLVLGALIYTLIVRPGSLPEPEPVSPFRHVDEAKARIYENLRDLQFELRLGKLSDEDYARTKVDLQKELAKVLAEADRLKAELGVQTAVKPAKAKVTEFVCPHCGQKFKEAMKFCGSCGKPMEASA